jgi:hypothetical protein
MELQAGCCSNCTKCRDRWSALVRALRAGSVRYLLREDTTIDPGLPRADHLE